MRKRVTGSSKVLALSPFDGSLVAAALDMDSAQTRHALAELVDYGLLVRDTRDGRYAIGHTLAQRFARTQIRVLPIFVRKRPLRKPVVYLLRPSLRKIKSG